MKNLIITEDGTSNQLTGNSVSDDLERPQDNEIEYSCYLKRGNISENVGGGLGIHSINLDRFSPNQVLEIRADYPDLETKQIEYRIPEPAPKLGVDYTINITSFGGEVEAHFSEMDPIVERDKCLIGEYYDENGMTWAQSYSNSGNGDIDPFDLRLVILYDYKRIGDIILPISSKNKSESFRRRYALIEQTTPGEPDPDLYTITYLEEMDVNPMGFSFTLTVVKIGKGLSSNVVFEDRGSNYAPTFGEHIGLPYISFSSPITEAGNIELSFRLKLDIPSQIFDYFGYSIDYNDIQQTKQNIKHDFKEQIKRPQ